MIVVMGHARLAPGEIDRLGEEMAAQITATRAEDGCIHYSFSRDVLDPDMLIISERWRDDDAIAAHMKSAHMATFNAAMGAAKIHEISVTSYESGEPRVLIGR